MNYQSLVNYIKCGYNITWGDYSLNYHSQGNYIFMNDTSDKELHITTDYGVKEYSKRHQFILWNNITN